MICVACCTTKETFSHLAECKVYQKIWVRIERIVLEEVGLRIIKEWSKDISNIDLERVLLGTNIEEKLRRRKWHLRGFTSKNRLKEVRELMNSSSKASRIMCWFTDLFWTNFYERLWKFRCEVMNNREKENNISIQEKRRKKKKHRKKESANKENSITMSKQYKESIGEKEVRMIKESTNKISK
jgi:hypothetical protein